MSKQTATPRKSAPITAHRLFPAIVALWFAALFGIGSFVVPPSVFEGPVVAMGLPKVLPAAAPPLGFTARALVSLLMTGIGATIGIVLGLRLARKPAPAAVERRTGPKKTSAPVKAAEPEPRQPLFASEAFAGIDPWSEPQAAPADETGAWTVEAADHGLASAGPEQPEEIAEFAGYPDEPEAAEATVVVDAEPALLAEPAPEPVAEGPQPAPEPAPADPIARLRRGATLEPDALRAARLDTLGTVQLVERLAMAMAAWRAPQPAVVHAPAPVLAVVPEPELVAAPQPEIASTWAPPQVSEMAAPVEPVALADENTEAADAWFAAEPEAAVIEAGPATLETPEEPVGPEIPAPAEIHRPSILAPLDLGADEDADEAAAAVELPRFLTSRPAEVAAAPEPEEAKVVSAPPQPSPVPLFRADFAEAVAAAPEETDEESASLSETEEEDRFPSLLDMAPRAPRGEAIRLSAADPASREDEAVADAAPYAMPFAPPASGLQTRRPTLGKFAATPSLPVAAPELPADPADAEEADRALRAALATLQRMSGSR